jgi:hypothetical protein
MTDRSEAPSCVLFVTGTAPRQKQEAAEAEEAMISLSRAVFARNGRMLLSSDESTLAVVALVAAEYASFGSRELVPPPVVVLGLTGGMVDTFQKVNLVSAVGIESAPELLGNADAMVCIGKQRRKDWELFERTSTLALPRPIYAFASTGAPLQGTSPEFDGILADIDSRFLRWISVDTDASAEGHDSKIVAGTSYPLIMQLLVEQVVAHRNEAR